MKISTKKIAICALFAALTYAATLISFPLPGNGYAHLGDCFVLLSSLLLGPALGAFSAGFGSAMADVTLGFALYAPATLVIKALMAVAAYYVFALLIRVFKGLSGVSAVLSAALAELIMVAGYFLFEWVIYGLPTAIADILGNLAQGAVGVVSYTVLAGVINANKRLKQMLTGQQK